MGLGGFGGCGNFLLGGGNESQKKEGRRLVGNGTWAKNFFHSPEHGKTTPQWGQENQRDCTAMAVKSVLTGMNKEEKRENANPEKPKEKQPTPEPDGQGEAKARKKTTLKKV